MTQDEHKALVNHLRLYIKEQTWSLKHVKRIYDLLGGDTVEAPDNDPNQLNLFESYEETTKPKDGRGRR